MSKEKIKKPKKPTKKSEIVDEILEDEDGMLGAMLPDIELEISDEEFLQTMEELTEDDMALLQELADPEPETEELEVIDHVKKTKKPRNYINNTDFLIQVALSNKQDQMTDELVRMLQTLTKRYGAKGNFAGYSFNEDMQCYAMYMLVRTWRAFNVERSLNPFAYFTQCIKNSFIQYLKKERKERDVRDKLLVNAGFNPSYAYGDSISDDGDAINSDY